MKFDIRNENISPLNLKDQHTYFRAFNKTNEKAWWTNYTEQRTPHCVRHNYTLDKATRADNWLIIIKAWISKRCRAAKQTAPCHTVSLMGPPPRVWSCLMLPLSPCYSWQTYGPRVHFYTTRSPTPQWLAARVFVLAGLFPIGLARQNTDCCDCRDSDSLWRPQREGEGKGKKKKTGSGDSCS